MPRSLFPGTDILSVPRLSRDPRRGSRDRGERRRRSAAGRRVGPAAPAAHERRRAPRAAERHVRGRAESLVERARARADRPLLPEYAARPRRALVDPRPRAAGPEAPRVHAGHTRLAPDRRGRAPAISSSACAKATCSSTTRTNPSRPPSRPSSPRRPPIPPCSPSSTRSTAPRGSATRASMP